MHQTAALGKTGNCQIGVSVHTVTDWASAAVDWRLFLPASWDDAADAGAGAEPTASSSDSTAFHSMVWLGHLPVAPDVAICVYPPI